MSHDILGLHVALLILGLLGIVAVVVALMLLIVGLLAWIDDYWQRRDHRFPRPS